MIRPETLKEFAELLRINGNYREVEFADEILVLLTLEDDVAEPYSNLCAELDHLAPHTINDAAKAVEWLGDRSGILEEIEKHLSEADKKGDADDAVKALLGTLADAEAILEDHGWPGTDFLDALENLAENTPTPLEYDL